MKRLSDSRNLVLGWSASVALTFGIIALTPAATSAVCNYGNCTQSYLCWEITYCGRHEQINSYYDTYCGEPDENGFGGTCWVYMCQFGFPVDPWDPTSCDYLGTCGTDYYYTCSFMGF